MKSQLSLLSRRLPRTALVAASTALFLGACAADGDDSGQDAEPPESTQESAPTATEQVTVQLFAFGPDSVTVAAGTEVVWFNGDHIDHTVTSGTDKIPDGTFSEVMPEMGASVSVTFEEAGTYEYFCEIHSFMTGEVVVTP